MQFMKNVVNRSRLGNPGELLMLAHCLKRDFEKYVLNEGFGMVSEQVRMDVDIRNDLSMVHLLEEHFSSPAHSV